MARGVGSQWRYDEAQLQRRLWSPIILQPGIFVDSRSSQNSLSASGVESVANLGTAFASFNRGTLAYTQLSLHNANGLPYLNKQILNVPNASGYHSSDTYSLQPTNGFSAYHFGLTHASSYAMDLSQWSVQQSMILAANYNTGFQIALFDGVWRSRTTTTQTSTDNLPVIMAQRKTAASATSFIDTFLSTYRTNTVRTSISCNNYTANATTVGFQGHPIGTADTKGKTFLSLHFQRYLTDREDDLVLGWGAWYCQMQHLLPANHPFVNRPPLIGD